MRSHEIRMRVSCVCRLRMRIGRFRMRRLAGNASRTSSACVRMNFATLWKVSHTNRMRIAISHAEALARNV